MCDSHGAMEAMEAVGVHLRNAEIEAMELWQLRGSHGSHGSYDSYGGGAAMEAMGLWKLWRRWKCVCAGGSGLCSKSDGHGGHG